MITNSFTWKIGGAAGEGIKVTGQILSKLFQHLGLNVFDYSDYPSLIRGGHNTYHIRAEAGPAPSHLYHVNLLVALDEQTAKANASEITSNGGMMYDPDEVKEGIASLPSHVSVYPVPFMQMIKRAGVKPLMKNTIALGATVQLLGLPFERLEEVIHWEFDRKGAKVVDEDLTVAKLGYEYARDHFTEPFAFKIEPIKRKEKTVMMTGNEAVALGAVHGGCTFYAAYPMTPSSSLLDAMAALGDAYGVVVKHAEDEISVMNMAIGAGFAGARAMVGTSGGGFSLMVEGLGLAGITETPLVIAEVQRPGPATGLPTWTEQGDLRFLLHAAQGEFPRIILAPGDISEAFHLTAWAFNLAEIYQMPVFILSDKYLAESNMTAPAFNLSQATINRGKLLSEKEQAGLKEYRRYAVTSDGISPRAIPGMRNARFLANSDEHDEFGYSEETSENRIAQADKRMRKLALAKSVMPAPHRYGPEHADVTFVAWGSMKGPVLEAMSLLKASGIESNFLHINIVWPFPTESVDAILQNARMTVLVENNATAQLGGIIREETGYHIDHQFLKYDGRPPHPHELHDFVATVQKRS